ncbi:esterase/lipase superfamily enzyme [Siphonobacter sp. BAB-5404]|nr:esterase/lipase superfamily enzyme [Siphonobacter sp. SORGH_AS_0500]
MGMSGTAHAWFSMALQKQMEMKVYGHAGARVLVFPTRRGRFYEYERLGLVEAIQDKIDQGWLQLFCVDSIDAESLYSQSIPPSERIKRHIQYEHYILDEVLPYSETLNPDSFLIVHGCSFGAFHAVNIALRHPQRFRKVVAFSGRYDLSAPVSEFRGLFDEYYDDTIYYHTPNHFLPNLHDVHLLEELQKLHFVLTIGNTDPFLSSSLQLRAALDQKNISNEFYIWEGRAHEADSWQKMVQIYL